MACSPGRAMICPQNFWSLMNLPNFCEVKLGSHEHPAHGQIYVMYHGTNYSAAVNIIKHGFRQSADGMLGRGVYVTREKQKALSFPQNDKSNQVILRLRVNVGKVKRIDAQQPHLMKTWHDQGYNTAWVPPHSSIVGIEEDCVWNPRRIMVVGISQTAQPQHKRCLQQLLKHHHHHHHHRQHHHHHRQHHHC